MHDSVSSGTAVRTTFASLVALVLSVLPVFMVGGVAVLLRDDLAFSESQLGIAISMFYAASTVASIAGGRLAESRGGLGAIRIGIVGSTAALLGIAVLARSWWHLLAWLAVAGVANAVIQPATNLALMQSIPLRRQALAFGLKQTNAPVATFLTGLSAPAIALAFGWRWAFAGAALVVVVFLAVGPRGEGRRPLPVGTGVAAGSPFGPALVLLTIAGGLGVATAMALVGFYMESAVAYGHSVAFAGWSLAAGSAVGMVARVFWGWLADRRRATGIGLVAGMLLTGSLSYAALGASGLPWVLAVTTIAVFVTGWGWVGLMAFAVVRVSPDAPGRASGFFNAGVSLGGIVGPFAFGLAVESAGYRTAWLAAAATVATAGLLVVAAGRLATNAEPVGTPVADPAG